MVNLVETTKFLEELIKVLEQVNSLDTVEKM